MHIPKFPFPTFPSRFTPRHFKRAVQAVAGLIALVTVGIIAIPQTWAGPHRVNALYAFGNATPALGVEGANLPAVDMVPTQGGSGYWVAGSDGSVYAYGDAVFYGSASGISSKSIVGMAVTRTGRGYWLVATDGGVFAFGDARFHGSTGAMKLNSPIVGMSATPTDGGYLLLGQDGGIFAFGDAVFRGSAADLATSSFSSIASTPGGGGYWIIHRGGAVYAFGNAPYLGGANGISRHPIVDLAGIGGSGYLLLAEDGGVFTFGSAKFFGSYDPVPRNATAIAARSTNDGYWVIASIDTPPPVNSGSGRRIVYSNSEQRVWMIEEDGGLYGTHKVSGKRGVPNPGTYSVFSKSSASSAHGGSLTLPYMTRFARGPDLAIGFHGIPLRRNGTPIQSDEELGQYRSAGCVRQNQSDARKLFDWASMGTKVVVLP